jgi:hypothetical protein
LRAVCPACGSLHAHRSRKKTVLDRVLGLAGLRVYRCESCNRIHHGAKWLKLLAPIPAPPAGRVRRYTSGWKHRYLAWRLRDGRHAHKALTVLLILLAAVGGFFLLLLNLDRWIAG